MGMWDAYLRGVEGVAAARARGRNSLFGSPEEQEQKALGLMGQAPGAYQLSPGEQFGNEQIPGLQTAGSGLLGSEMGFGDKAKYYLGMLGAGYNPQEALGALSLQQQEQGPTQKEVTQAQKDILTSHEGRVKATRSSLERFNEATDLITERGGFEGMSGEDDTSMITFFAQMQRPGEAMNEGDVAQILASAGLGDIASSYIKLLKGEGRLSDPQRARMYRSMQSMAQSRQQQYGDIRNVTQEMINPYGQQLGNIMRPAVDVNPYPIRPEDLYSRDQMEEEARKRGIL